MENELYHHGVKGMKWGVRRYQNKDGSLIKTGKKKMQRFGLFKKKDKKDDTKHDDDSKTQTKSKTHKEMTDAELIKKTNRLNLEANYLTAYNRVNPAQVAKGESFAKKFMNEAVKPALINAGRRQIENALNKEIEKLTKGKVDPDSIEALKATAEKLDLKKRISENKKTIAVNDKWFAKQKEEADKAKQAEQRRAEAQKQVDDYNKGDRSNDRVTAASYRMKGDDISNRYTQTRNVSNPPAVIKNAITNLSNVSTSSETYSRASNKGEQFVYDVLDRDGNKIASSTEIKKRKRWR